MVKKYLIICYYIQYRSVSNIFWKSHLVNSKDALILAYCLPFGKAGGLQILCCQGIKVTDYNFTLDALALKPSGFCNVRVICRSAEFVWSHDLKMADKASAWQKAALRRCKA
jgi:hypothetical protein